MWARDHQVGPVGFRFLALYGVFQGPRELRELEEGKNYSTPSRPPLVLLMRYFDPYVENILSRRKYPYLRLCTKKYFFLMSNLNQ